MKEHVHQVNIFIFSTIIDVGNSCKYDGDGTMVGGVHIYLYMFLRSIFLFEASKGIFKQGKNRNREHIA